LIRDVILLGIFLDTETSGLNALKHRILEISFKIVDLFTGDLIEVYSQIISQPKKVWMQSDVNSLQINGFTWDIISQGVEEKQIKEEIIEIFKKVPIQRKSSVFICQNPSFDRSFFTQIIEMKIQDDLKWPYHWFDLASMFWAISIQKAKETSPSFLHQISFSKDSIAKFYNLPIEKKPHKAMNGVDHLLLCYEKVVGFPEKLNKNG